MDGEACDGQDPQGAPMKIVCMLKVVGCGTVGILVISDIAAYVAAVVTALTTWLHFSDGVPPY